MSLGSAMGSTAMGHKGWIKVRCIICGKWLDTTNDPVYVCTKCLSNGVKTYYCSSDAKKLHYKCPFCHETLQPL